MHRAVATIDPHGVSASIGAECLIGRGHPSHRTDPGLLIEPLGLTNRRDGYNPLDRFDPLDQIGRIAPDRLSDMRDLEDLLPTIDLLDPSDPLGLIDPSPTRPPGPPEPTAMPVLAPILSARPRPPHSPLIVPPSGPQPICPSSHPSACAHEPVHRALPMSLLAYQPVSTSSLTPLPLPTAACEPISLCPLNGGLADPSQRPAGSVRHPHKWAKPALVIAYERITTRTATL